MAKKHNPGCPCCEKLPPDCACADDDCFESYGNYSSVRVEIEFDQDDWNYYERIRTFYCGGTCIHKYRDIEVYREMSGFLQFNGTYDIGFYTYNSIDGAVESTPAEEPCGYWFFPTLFGEMYRRTETTYTNEYGCLPGSTTEVIRTPTMTLETKDGGFGWQDDGVVGLKNLSTVPFALEIDFGLGPIGWPGAVTFRGNTLFECEPEYTGENYTETTGNPAIAGGWPMIPFSFQNFESNMTGFLNPPLYSAISITIDGVPGWLVNATSGCIRNWGQTRSGLNAYSHSREFAPTSCSNFRRPGEYEINFSAFSWRIKVSLNV